MQSLIDPLKELAKLNATASVAVNMVEGVASERRVSLTFDRRANYDEKRKAEMIRRRFEVLLLMQLDVAPGDLPRTVQQLVASGRILVVGGRYVMGGKG